MSRVGKEPVPVTSGATVTITNGVVSVKGKNGELTYTLLAGINAEVKDGNVHVTRASDDRKLRGFHGLTRTLIKNMIEGVVTGYSKGLEIEGVGFKSALQGQRLILSLGFASPKPYDIPNGVKVTVDTTGTKIGIAGPDKQLVGRVAADIRAYFPAEPYKGKGIKYAGEKIRRKEGKTVA